MGFKERGNLGSMVFQGVADTELFLFLAVLVIVGNIRAGIKIVVTDLKLSRALRPISRGLRQFLTGDERVAYTSV